MQSMAWYAIGAAALISAAACSSAVGPDAQTPRVPATPGTPGNPGMPAPPVPTEPPHIDAGPDLFVALTDSTLSLRAWNASGDIRETRWTRISGAASLQIMRADGYNPEIAGLEKGVYTLQVAVRDGRGSVGMDTLAVHVVDAAAIQTLTFLSRSWSCPFGCTTRIGNVDQLMPAGALMRVQIRSGGSTAWNEVHALWGDRYIYALDGRELYLYADNEENLTDVRVLWTVP